MSIVVKLCSNKPSKCVFVRDIEEAHSTVVSQLRELRLSVCAQMADKSRFCAEGVGAIERGYGRRGVRLGITWRRFSWLACYSLLQQSC